MTLREILAAHPDRFYRQSWYEREAFLDIDVQTAVRLPAFTVCATPNGQELPRAAMLAALYLQYPKAPIWDKWLWCRDTDHLGQRVFVGGVSVSNGYLFEIHRHLHITPRFGVATW